MDDALLLTLTLALAYAAAAVTLAVFALSTERRDAALRMLGMLHARGRARLGAFLGALTAWPQRAGRAGRRCAAHVWDWARTRPWTLALAAALIMLPLAAGLVLGRHSPLEGYEDLADSDDPVIIALLRGEQLVPPPPLPPELFAAPEVREARPDLVSASREWALLDAQFRLRLLGVFRAMEMRGYSLVLLEGYRSPQRQADLAAQTRKVTSAGAYQSYHQYGLAADCAFLRNGRIVISERDPWALEGYRLYGELAVEFGLTWGGDWTLRDYGHVELRRPGVLGKR